jgi:hypothetical protein
MRIKWEDDNVQAVYDDMVSCLISSIEGSRATPIDGSGGDGGCDIQVMIDGELHVKELKKFTGRLGREGNRRQQVEKSLARAALLKPASWTLIAPIKPTPGEIEWFGSLRAKYSFPLEWLDKTWLDKQMADYPAISRYYVKSMHEEVLDHLRELNKEEAALAGGWPDVRERLRTLQKRIDEASPHYRLDIEFGPNGTGVSLSPKYVGAEADYPITIKSKFTFPTTEEGQRRKDSFLRLRDFGIGSVELKTDDIQTFEVDAPLGLGFNHSTQEGGERLLKIIAVPEDVDNVGRLTILDPADNRLGSLELRFEQQHAGQRGGGLIGHDVTGCLRVSMLFDLTERRREFSYEADLANRFPSDLLGVVRVLQFMHMPNRIEIDCGLPEPERFEAPAEPPVGTDFIQFLNDLVEIQSHLNTVFKIPDPGDRDERNRTHAAAQLLRGETVEIDNEVQVLTGGSPDAVVQIINDDPDALHRIELSIGGHATRVYGHDVVFGPVQLEMSKTKVRVETGDETGKIVTLDPTDDCVSTLRVAD